MFSPFSFLYMTKWPGLDLMSSETSRTQSQSVQTIHFLAEYPINLWYQYSSKGILFVAQYLPKVRCTSSCHYSCWTWWKDCDWVNFMCCPFGLDCSLGTRPRETTARKRGLGKTATKTTQSSTILCRPRGPVVLLTDSRPAVDSIPPCALPADAAMYWGSPMWICLHRFFPSSRFLLS